MLRVKWVCSLNYRADFVKWSHTYNLLECVWNLMVHGDARLGKWRGNWRMEWVATLPRNAVYPALLPLMRIPLLRAVDWTDAPADLNGLVSFAERRKLVSARVPSHFKRSVLQTSLVFCQSSWVSCTTSKSGPFFVFLWYRVVIWWARLYYTICQYTCRISGGPAALALFSIRNPIEKDELGKVSGACVGEWKCAQCFDWETCWKETIRKT